MKRKLFTALAILSLVIMTLGASRKSDELKRMSIFVSNFTEAGLSYNFDVDEDSDSDLTHLGKPENVSELIRFGIIHNVINNPNTAIKKCTDRKCEYGHHIISGQSVAASVMKYFNKSIKNQSIDGECYYDGKNYHIEASDWKPDTVYYADVQNVEYEGNLVVMSGEIYNVKNRRDRPATFLALAKPHVWNDKDTWAIVTLNVDWR